MLRQVKPKSKCYEVELSEVVTYTTTIVVRAASPEEAEEACRCLPQDYFWDDWQNAGVEVDNIYQLRGSNEPDFVVDAGRLVRPAATAKT